MPTWEQKTKKSDDCHSLILGCDCGDNEHQVILSYYTDDPSDYWLSVSPHLVHWTGFWKRLVIAIKYVFGYKCKYGQWDEVLLYREDAIGLIDFLKGYVECKK